MTTYTNAAGVNPAMLHGWGPFYIITVFSIILHLSFGDRLSQNRRILCLSLFSLKVIENFSFHLRRSQSIALLGNLRKKTLSIFFIFYTQEAPLPFPQLPWFKSLFHVSFKSSLVVVAFLHFYFEVGIMYLKPVKGLGHVFIYWAVARNCHKLGGFKQQKCIAFQFWRQKFKIKVLARLSLNPLGENLSLSLPNL